MKSTFGLQMATCCDLTTGSYGVHIYGTSSKVVANADQFSVRLDHDCSDKKIISLLDLIFKQSNGPPTNPDQTAIDPSFGFSTLIGKETWCSTYPHLIA
jgi:hypothetical protein